MYLNNRKSVVIVFLLIFNPTPAHFFPFHSLKSPSFSSTQIWIKPNFFPFFNPSFSPEAQKLPYYSSYGPARLAIHKLCTSHYLDLVITFIICINVITMSLEHYSQPQVRVRVFQSFSKYTTCPVLSCPALSFIFFCLVQGLHSYRLAANLQLWISSKNTSRQTEDSDRSGELVIISEDS